jgi:hypothetical protein
MTEDRERELLAHLSGMDGSSEIDAFRAAGL